MSKRTDDLRPLTTDLLQVSKAAAIGVPFSCAISVLYGFWQSSAPEWVIPPSWIVVAYISIALCVASVIPAVALWKWPRSRALWWPLTLALVLGFFIIRLDDPKLSIVENSLRLMGSQFLWTSTFEALAGFVWFGAGLWMLEDRRLPPLEFPGFAAAVGLKWLVLAIAGQFIVPFFLLWPLLTMVEVAVVTEPDSPSIPAALRGAYDSPRAFLLGLLGGLSALLCSYGAAVGVQALLATEVSIMVIFEPSDLPALIVGEAVWSVMYWWAALWMYTALRHSRSLT